MIDAWIESKGGIVRYAHGERPEGAEIPNISAWRRGRKTSAAEKQAAKDSEE